MREKIKNEKVIFAREYASRLHNLQRYGKHLFIKHLNDVYKVATRMEVEDEAILVSCFLFNTVEENKVTIGQISYQFGKEVADIVNRVTNNLGSNPQETAQKTYPKIKGNEKATILKLSERIAKVEMTINEKDHNLVRNYQQEYKKFKELLKTDGIADKFWNHLDKLLSK